MLYLCRVKAKHDIQSRRLGATLLLALFSVYVGCIIGCYHPSIVDGRLIAHAHRLVNSNLPDEHHDPAELVQLDQVSHIIITGEIVPHVEIKAPIGRLLPSFIPQEEGIDSVLCSIFSGRAPPRVAA